MLILTRKCGESVVVGDGIEIRITEICGDKVKVGITAPGDVKIYRKELYETIRENRSAAKAAPPASVKDFLQRLE